MMNKSYLSCHMSVTITQQKDIDKVLKKYSDCCSICKDRFEDDDLTYTVFGYDKLQRMQVVSGCCIEKIVRPVLLGLCGCYDPNEINNLMKEHPLASQFFNDKI